MPDRFLCLFSCFFSALFFFFYFVCGGGDDDDVCFFSLPLFACLNNNWRTEGCKGST